MSRHLILSGLASLCMAAGLRAQGLSELKLQATGGVPLTPRFQEDITSYRASVQSDIAQVELQCLPVDEDAAVSIQANGQAPDPRTPALVPLAVGENTLTVTVGVPGGMPVEYRIQVTREDIRPVAERFQKDTFTDPATGAVMPYRLFTPEPRNQGVSYPLVVFLHGSGERGADNWKPLLANQGGTIWAKPEEQARRPCYVLVPQARDAWDGGFGLTRDQADQFDLSRVFTPANDLKTAQALLDRVLAEHPDIDRKRLYCTGLSQGGIGTWNWNLDQPGRFAAMVPVCGAGDPARAKVLAKKPVWAFHAESDPVIPVRYQRDLVDALQAAGGKPRYTEFSQDTYIHPSAHFSWVLAYRNAAMREWLFKQKLP
jgi:predicted peptidase